MRFSAFVKVAFISLFFVFCFLLIKAPAFAQTVPLNQNQVSQSLSADTNPDVPKNLHTWTQNVMIEVMAAAICQLSGIDVTNTSQSCLGIDPQTKKIGFVKNGGGLIGFFQNSIVFLYTPPAHAQDFINYLANNFGIAKSVYAQRNSAQTPNGIGFASITPLMGIWTSFRDVAYLAFVVIFLIIGIGIMLRVHIDPRTVMTIQNQIPKIIIAIILVTFSFAIAGFLIDFMYVVTYLLLGLIASSDTNMTSNIVMQLVSSTNPLDAANAATSGGHSLWMLSGLADLAFQPAGTIGGFITGLFNNPVGGFIATIVGAILGTILGHAAGSAVGPLAGLIAAGAVILAVPSGGLTLAIVGAAATAGALTSNFVTAIVSAGGAITGALAGSTILGTVAGVIAFLIILIAILTTLLRVWFMLLTSYIGILVDIIFAPLWIMLGLIPTSKLTFNTWLRDIVSNLSAFPTALVMFLLARLFIDAFGASNGQLFVAPLIGNPSDIHGLASLIALGIFLLTPSTVTAVKGVFKGPLGFGKVGQPLGAGIGMLVNTGRRAIRARTAAEEYRVSDYDAKGGAKWEKNGGLRGFIRGI